MFLSHRLREKSGVRKTGTDVSTIVHGERRTCSRGKVFADASYEGDLMAQAGVSLHLGPRRRSTEYGESLAGVREQTPLHQFRAPVSPVDARGTLLPEIMPRTDGCRSAPRTSACRPTTSACA